MKYINKATRAIIALVFIFFFSMSWGARVLCASASSDFDSYSDVVSDLTKDEDFNVWSYPLKDNDNSLQVIQIAESTDGKLFVYVYQPNAAVRQLTATYINMSLSESSNGTQLYKLQLLNRSGVFCKYLVTGVTVSSAPIRYYNITSIYRAWDKYIDKGTGNDNTVNEVVFEVGQLWTAQTVDGETKYSMLTTETITVTTKYAGYVQYADGVSLGWAETAGATMAHFVAFSTDKPIEKLMEADVYFIEQTVNAKICGNPVHINHTYKGWFDYQYGDKVEHNPPLKLTYKDKASNQGGGYVVNGNKYTWDRIASTADFIQQHEHDDYKITTEGVTSLAGTQWVLSFYETPLQAKVDNVWLPLISAVALPFVGDVDVKYAEVSEVSILRLKFETAGKVYDLGTVDNKQTGGDKPINEHIPDGQKIITLWVIIAVVAVVAVVVLAILFPPFGRLILAILKGLWVVISLPFRMLAKGIKKLSERRKPAKSLGKSGESLKGDSTKKTTKSKAKQRKTGNAKQTAKSKGGKKT